MPHREHALLNSHISLSSCISSCHSLGNEEGNWLLLDSYFVSGIITSLHSLFQLILPVVLSVWYSSPPSPDLNPPFCCAVLGLALGRPHPALQLASWWATLMRGARGKLQVWKGKKQLASFPLLPVDFASACQCHASSTSSPRQWQVLPVGATESSLQFFQYLQNLLHGTPSSEAPT